MVVMRSLRTKMTMKMEITKMNMTTKRSGLPLEEKGKAEVKGKERDEDGEKEKNAGEQGVKSKEKKRKQKRPKGKEAKMKKTREELEKRGAQMGLLSKMERARVSRENDDVEGKEEKVGPKTRGKREGKGVPKLHASKRKPHWGETKKAMGRGMRVMALKTRELMHQKEKQTRLGMATSTLTQSRARKVRPSPSFPSPFLPVFRSTFSFFLLRSPGTSSEPALPENSPACERASSVLGSCVRSILVPPGWENSF